MKIFSNQTESDAIYELYSTGSFFLTTTHLRPKTMPYLVCSWISYCELFTMSLPNDDWNNVLTHLPLDKMAAIPQIISYVISWMKSFVFW